MKFYICTLIATLTCFSTLSYAEEIQLAKPIRMSITSPAFSHEGIIPMQYTCDGQDDTPPLSIKGVPENTKSLMLIAVDKESSHPPEQIVNWFIYNIPPQTKTIETNQIPQQSLIGFNATGNRSYESPCPKDLAIHHYYFTLYALDTVLPNTVTNLREASNLLEGHLVAHASLMGTYAKS